MWSTGLAGRSTKGQLTYTERPVMDTCNICRRKSADVYPLDGHFVCESCLMQGRLEEMPDFAIIERHELDLVGAGATVSSWWNREIPRKPAHP